METTLAVVGVAGTLLGVFIGALTTYKVQSRQIAHENSTRFHDLRVQRYAEFTMAANQAVSYFVTDKYDFDSCMEFQKLFNVVRLVASSAVLEEANRINVSFGTMQNLAIANKTVPTNEVDTFNSHVQAFITQARSELSTW